MKLLTILFTKFIDKMLKSYLLLFFFSVILSIHPITTYTAIATIINKGIFIKVSIKETIKK